MTFLVKLLNQGDQYVKATGGAAAEFHIKPGDSAEILLEDGDSLAAVQETEEEAILAMTALTLPDLAATEKETKHKLLVKKLQEKAHVEKREEKFLEKKKEEDHKLHLPEKDHKGNGDAATNR